MSPQTGAEMDGLASRSQVEHVFAEIASAIGLGLYVFEVVDPLDPGSLRLSYGNPASVVATGAELRDIIGRPIRESFPHLMETPRPATYLAIALGGSARDIGDIEYQDERMTGGTFSIRAFPLPGQRVGISFTSVTGQRLAEQRAVETLESMSDAFFTLDTDWRFTYLNPQTEVILERRRVDLLGKNVWEEFPEEVGSCFYDAYYRAVRDQVPVHVDGSAHAVDRALDVRAYPISTGLAVYFRDVTRDYAVEKQRRLGRRMEALGRVTAAVAHDFSNLLFVIRGCATLGERAAGDALKAAELFEQIDSAGEKASELTRQLLAFGRDKHCFLQAWK